MLFRDLDVLRIAADVPGVHRVVARLSAVGALADRPGSPPDVLAHVYELPETDLVEHAAAIGWTWDGARWDKDGARSGKPLFPPTDELAESIGRQPWRAASHFAKRWQCSPVAVTMYARRVGWQWSTEALNMYGKPGYWVECEPHDPLPDMVAGDG